MPSFDAIGSVFGIRTRSFGVSACVVLAVAASGVAQQSNDATYVVAQADGIQLRSGQGAGFYATGEVAAGQRLLVTQEGGQWNRVQYPAGSEAYVAADAVAVSGGWATLIAERSLRHINPRTGKRGSWKPLLDAPLPVGTRLEVVSFEDSAQAQHKAYRVIAPQGAQAYIESSTVRAATPDEVSLYLASIGSGAARPGDLVRSDVGSTGEETVPVPNESDPVALVEPTPVELQPQTLVLASGTQAQLEAAFQAVRKQPIAEAEYDELIAEYRRALESLDEREANEPLRIAYQQRLDLLLMQQKFQQVRRETSASLTELEKGGESLAKAIEELNKNRRYVVIGRLTTSVVYNGERLPMMYRIQSVGDRIPRTLGYLRPNKDLDLAAKVGRVVGIEGDTLLDQALKLNVVTPSRVDVLTPTEEKAPVKEPAAETPTESSGG